MGHPYNLINNIVRRKLDLLIIMIFKSVRESIVFQSNKFTACKVEDGKQVLNYLMVFSLLILFIHFKVKPKT